MSALPTFLRFPNFTIRSARVVDISQLGRQECPPPHRLFVLSNFDHPLCPDRRHLPFGQTRMSAPRLSAVSNLDHPVESKRAQQNASTPDRAVLRPTPSVKHYRETERKRSEPSEDSGGIGQSDFEISSDS